MAGLIPAWPNADGPAPSPKLVPKPDGLEAAPNPANKTNIIQIKIAA